MDRSGVAEVLAACEAALKTDGAVDLGPLGFWKAVAAAKRDPSLVTEFGSRFAEVDRAAFERWALVTIPAGIGTTLAIAATVLGLVVIGIGYYVDAPWNGLLLLAGFGVVLIPTHGLGHLVVGGRSGMRITHWFIGTIGRPQPGVKLDYATYLAAPARARAWMHASGALVTKAIPFMMLGAAWGMNAPAWAWTALLVVGVGQIVTDIVWSTKASDWKKYRREMRYAE